MIENNDWRLTNHARLRPLATKPYEMSGLNMVNSFSKKLVKINFLCDSGGS